MNQIKFDTAQAQQVAGKIKSQGTAVEKNIADLAKKIGDLRGFWEGESAAAYLKQFDELQPDLKKMVTCMNEISEQLKKVASIKASTEQQIAQQIMRR